MRAGPPWGGKEGWSTNIQAPVRAIYLLEGGEQDSITEIGIAEAFRSLMQQTYAAYVVRDIRKWIQMLKEMEGKVRFFRFLSTMTAESVRMAYEAAQAAGPIL